MTVGVGSFARCCISTTVAAGSFARCSGLRFDACRSNVSTGSSSASLSVVPRRIFYTKSTGSYSGFHTLNFNGFCTTRPFSTVSFARLAFLAGFSLPFPTSSGFPLDVLPRVVIHPPEPTLRCASTGAVVFWSPSLVSFLGDLFFLV